jgi:hypothetical protein
MAFLGHILWHGWGVGNSGSAVPKLAGELVQPKSSTVVFFTGAPAAEENKPLFRRKLAAGRWAINGPGDCVFSIRTINQRAWTPHLRGCSTSGLVMCMPLGL